MRVVLAWVVPLLALGCSFGAASTTGQDSADDDAAPSGAVSVQQAVAEWSRDPASSYVVRVTEDDQLSPSRGCTWVTEIHDGKADLRWIAVFDVDCGDRDVSVPALHEQLHELQDLADDGRGQLHVEWADLGIPEHISFTPTRGDATSLSIEFADIDDENSVQGALAAARSDWAAAGIDDYRLDLVESVNYWSRGCTWTAVVAGGDLATVSVDSTTNSYCSEVDWTVELLFDMVSGWTDEIERFDESSFGEHTLIAEFGFNGVPTLLEFDLANGADEETSLQISFSETSD